MKVLTLTTSMATYTNSLGTIWGTNPPAAASTPSLLTKSHASATASALQSKATTSYYSFKLPAFTTASNLGPLTSSLKFPSGCYNNLLDMNRDGLGPSGAWKTIGCAMSTCCPGGNFYTEDWGYMTSYYSPGICPSDYQSCDPPTQSGLILTPREGEKIVFCCPNNCICPNDEDMPLIIPGGCGSRLTISSETTVYTVMNNLHDQKPQETLPYEFDTGFTEELQIAYPIQIRLPATPSSSTIIPNSSGTSIASQKPVLSTSAIVGIAFGGFFSIFTTCLITYLVLKSRKKHRWGEDQSSLPDQNIDQYLYSEGPSQMPEVSRTPMTEENHLQNSMVPQRKPVPQQFWSSGGAPFEMPSTSPQDAVELPTVLK
ncbi:uncharacterized protein BDR25DRAFT_341613 [Lindgomyces ingoldianus]|uniref:Uncharacterized protein n=1 Tax=Lindgomyces ingoldianus TaxID=673940 RepID=A0ACB6R0T3_9PLEO|nr:uncharacterized protein BDR25DRAFT_341613 [Lindgomyces ingoldianus]KAF2472751.1 hypothetical protein BDR25DRAFT_341613 [Lindgomyces ingoldianus]